MRLHILLLAMMLGFLPVAAQRRHRPAANDSALLWLDAEGQHINAHGGNIIRVDSLWYWYGENRPMQGFTTEVGVEVYSSPDLQHWTDRGVALAVSETPGSPIQRGCIMERPKVQYNPVTQQYVMLFHLELKGRGYEAAEVGFAVSKTPLGPFRFLYAQRPNAGKWPADFSRKDIKQALKQGSKKYESWTPQWHEAIRRGMFTARDLAGGQMSRDMTLYVDADGTAYQITSSEDNLTLQINELSTDWLSFTGRYWRVAPGGQNEAPAIFKHGGKYWLITSGCTGWDPNSARMFVAEKITGPWQQVDSPMQGPGSEHTFGAQGTYILQTEEGPVFMADIWKPRHLQLSSHLWLPIHFDTHGTPIIYKE